VKLRPGVGTAALAALGLLLAGAVGACSGPPDRSAPTLADVRNVLAQHGAAVMHHDRQAFAADLDPAQQAAGFRSRQLAAFANLGALPLASWTYQVQSRTDFHESEVRASRRFGTGAVIVQISLRYALRGVDRVPTSHDLWWTFVRHDGRVVIAADDGLTYAGGDSWKGPWDFGRLLVLRGPHSLVLGHPDHATSLPELRDAVEAAVPAVSAVWGNAWSRDVAVIVPSSATELTAQAGRSSDLTLELAALALSDGQDPLTGAVYGQRLIVNPDALAKLSAVGRQIVIRHEVTHIADAAATTDATPQWLIEGFPEYIANLNSGQPVPVAASELAAAVRHGRAPTALPSPSDFATGGQAAQAYEGAWLACRLIAQRAGQAALVQLYRLVGTSPQDPTTAINEGLRRVLHVGTAQFTAQWRAYVIAQLRR
jgi:hypothetical protein